jgi:hypothetical protein
MWFFVCCGHGRDREAACQAELASAVTDHYLTTGRLKVRCFVRQRKIDTELPDGNQDAV